MILTFEINCKFTKGTWNLQSCLTCPCFTCKKDEKGWTCACALNATGEKRYHFFQMWCTELAILSGVMHPDDRPGLAITQVPDNQNGDLK